MRYQEVKDIPLEERDREEFEEQDIPQAEDPVEQTLRERINKYNFMQEMFSQVNQQQIIPQQPPVPQMQMPPLTDPYAEYLGTKI
jgi:hypothetical protein